MNEVGTSADPNGLSNQELLQLVERQSSELNALRRISLNLTSRLDLEVVLQAVAKEAMSLVSSAGNIGIFLYEDGELRFGAAYDKEGRAQKAFAQPRPGGLTHTVIESKEIVVVEDMRTHPIYAGAPTHWRGSIIGVPLLALDRVVGVMNLARTSIGAFSEDELRLVGVLASQAAIAISNASLHEEVSRHSRVLEQTVAERTAELSAKVIELGQMRDRMVEQEKIASLAGLVAGLGHEINTPIGTGLTAISYLQRLTENFTAEFEQSELTRSGVAAYLEKSREACRISSTSLERAVKLVTRFKMLSTDQQELSLKEFDVHAYISDLLTTLEAELRLNNVEITFECPGDLVIHNYPAALSRIIVTLVRNSLAHGFRAGGGGNILLSIQVTDGNLTLQYRDDGEGMADETKHRVFDPFYTTRRGEGYIGLGMTTIHGLVHQKLEGSIEIQSRPGEGMTCVIRCPRDFPKT